MHQEKVTFNSHGETIVGNLFICEGQPKGCIVLTGPITSVKEQATGQYGLALAKRGYVALAFDHRFFGESSGEPRQFESPPKKIEDISAAVTYLLESSRFNGLPVYGVGVCAGGGYMAGAVEADDRIRGFGGVAGYYNDAASSKRQRGDGFEDAIASGREARKKFEAGEPAPRIPAVGTEGEVAMPLAEAYEFYGTPRGAVPNYTNSYAIQSREVTTPFDIVSNASNVSVPTLIIHSENALAPEVARKFYAAISAPKEDLWLESKGQIDFYDDPNLIGQAADALDRHLAAIN